MVHKPNKLNHHVARRKSLYCFQIIKYYKITAKIKSCHNIWYELYNLKNSNQILGHNLNFWMKFEYFNRTPEKNRESIQSTLHKNTILEMLKTIVKI